MSSAVGGSRHGPQGCSDVEMHPLGLPWSTERPRVVTGMNPKMSPISHKPLEPREGEPKAY